MGENMLKEDMTCREFVQGVPDGTTFIRLFDCLKACAGMENPEKEIAALKDKISYLEMECDKYVALCSDKDAEIARLTDDVVGFKKSIYFLCMIFYPDIEKFSKYLQGEDSEKDAEIAHLTEYNQQLFDAVAANAQRGTPETISLINEIARLREIIGTGIDIDMSLEKSTLLLALDHANDEVERLTKALKECEADNSKLMQSKLDVELDNAALRAVLEKYQYPILAAGLHGIRACFCCGQSRDHGCTPGCEIARMLNGEKKQ